jgi:spore germination protein
MTARQTISARQFAILVVGAFLGAGLFQFPRELFVYGKADAAWGYLIDCAAAFFGLRLWFLVNRLSPGEPVGQALPRYVTPLLGWPLRVLTVALHLSMAVFVLLNYAFVMKTFFLPQTPVLGLEIFMLAAAGYMAFYNTPALGRIAEMLAPPAIVLTTVLSGLVAGHIHAGYAMLPTFPPQLMPVLLAAYHSYYIFFGYEVTITLYPHVAESERLWAERYAGYAMLVTMVWYAIGFVLVVGTEDPYFLAILQWPPVVAMELANLVSFIINRLGLFVVAFWGIFAEVFIAIRLWCLAHDVLPSLGYASLRAYRWILVGFCGLALLVSSYVSNIAMLIAILQVFLLPAMLVFNYALPPVILLGHRIANIDAAPAADPAPAE